MVDGNGESDSTPYIDVGSAEYEKAP